VFDESRYRASAGRSAHEQSRTSAQSPGVPQVFVIGANASTLGLVTSLKDDPITAQLVPVAVTPMGAVLGDNRQKVGVARAGFFDWADRTFPADDERAFIGSLRDLELLLRVGWDSSFPEVFDERSVLNADDVPDELLDAIGRPQAALVQCAVCRRLCVRDDFPWKERPLCAWDFHAQVFGKRGPWREGGYEARHFETLPACAYVVPALLDELDVAVLLALGNVSPAGAHALVRTLLESEEVRSHMAVRTATGIVVLCEG